ncbi:Ribosomal protein S24/S35 [Thalictrum thalictroides]|uniref:Ribosomal protein S24/S35 n=1 Tax=Thalictrum thalictroides TaxID=46969 RepID=A0A7J6W4D3_THATH|nr:Ribosomal protein S24/S35 [Thalictrum thalictroides]
MFLLKPTYEVPREDGHKQQWWKQLWGPQNIPKHAFITWMTWQAALTTLDKLVDWRYYLTQTAAYATILSMALMPVMPVMLDSPSITKPDMSHEVPICNLESRLWRCHCEGNRDCKKTTADLLANRGCIGLFATGNGELFSEGYKQNVSDDFEDVTNEDFDRMVTNYGDILVDKEEAASDIMKAILKRRISKKHEQTDDEFMDELRDEDEEEFMDIDDTDGEIESDFEELCKTDDEIEDLYNARQHVEQKMMKDEFFNMSDTKWDDMIREGVENGHLMDTKECEEILEDMMSWDKLLPDEIKEKVEAKYNELGDMCERGEIEPEAAYELFKEFEDEMVLECQKITAAEQPPMEDVTGVPDKKKDLDDPPGEGPILRWQSRVVFCPGGDAWHPKNRKVKLSVTVKELGLTKPAFRRLRALVGKRYHPGKDELTITSERFEHREENRKDCLRTLFALIEEAAKAKKFVEDTQASHSKDRLKANPAFMEKLRAKTMKMKANKN